MYKLFKININMYIWKYINLYYTQDIYLSTLLNNGLQSIYIICVIWYLYYNKVFIYVPV